MQTVIKRNIGMIIDKQRTCQKTGTFLAMQKRCQKIGILIAMQNPCQKIGMIFALQDQCQNGLARFLPKKKKIEKKLNLKKRLKLIVAKLPAPFGFFNSCVFS